MPPVANSPKEYKVNQPINERSKMLNATKSAVNPVYTRVINVYYAIVNGYYCCSYLKISLPYTSVRFSFILEREVYLRSVMFVRSFSLGTAKLNNYVVFYNV